MVRLALEMAGVRLGCSPLGPGRETPDHSDLATMDSHKDRSGTFSQERDRANRERVSLRHRRAPALVPWSFSGLS
jgi:hypothetical protein